MRSTRRNILLGVVFCCFVFSLILSRKEKVEKSFSAEDVKRLPLVRTEVREKEDCPGVTERIEYRLVTDKDGNKEEIAFGFVDDQILENPFANKWGTWLKSSLVTRPALNCLKQEDEKLIKVIKEDYLKPPSKTAGNPYNFSVPIKDLNYFSDAGQAEDIDDLFGNSFSNGFFLEAGSLDSEHFSTTLLLELDRNWTGLLVEPIPLFHAQGLLKNRRATHLQTCLATQDRPHYVKFDLNHIYDPTNNATKAMGGIRDTENSIEMQCLPLYSILQAMGNPTVNYFSLDIEGAELQVLLTLPWDKVDIEVLSIETHLAGKIFPGSEEDIFSLLGSAGYDHFPHPGSYDQDRRIYKDHFFVRRDVRRRICGNREEAGSKTKNTVCHDGNIV